MFTQNKNWTRTTKGTECLNLFWKSYIASSMPNSCLFHREKVRLLVRNISSTWTKAHLEFWNRNPTFTNLESITATYILDNPNRQTSCYFSAKKIDRSYNSHISGRRVPTELRYSYQTDSLFTVLFFLDLGNYHLMYLLSVQWKAKAKKKKKSHL